tara:strand:+ start:303 stop:1313 length:1011 start_codon:yes stop_codon:yes gene_type:complete
MDCRTAKLGTQQWKCNHCDYEQLHYCSCRDRHCPRCQGEKTQQWAEAQQAQVINTRYFHLVFTLPHELNVITHYAQTELYSALFEAVSQTLDKFAHNRKRLKGQLGITMVLHTWGQTLSQHIHIHCLVPGGVLDAANHCQSVKTDYLFPVKALSKVFKAKMLQALRTRKVSIPNADMLMTSPWCVYSKACLTKPETVIKYLSRYTQKGMLSETRLQSVDEQNVTFYYRDYHQLKGLRTMTLSGVEFVRRYVSHILPKGFMRVRHYGFLSNCCRGKKLSIIQKQTQGATPNKEDSPPASCSYHWACPKCKQGELLLVGLNMPPTHQHKQEEVYRLTG